MAKTVYVLNGPNLNLLGTREPQTYGRATLADLERLCREAAKRHALALEFRQSNHEGELIDWIHEAGAKKAAGVVLNAGGYTHSSIAIRDAVAAVAVPVIEVHDIRLHRTGKYARSDCQRAGHQRRPSAARGVLTLHSGWLALRLRRGRLRVGHRGARRDARQTQELSNGA